MPINYSTGAPDCPSPEQQAFDDGRWGREMYLRYYYLGDPEEFAAYQAGSALFEEQGPPMTPFLGGYI